MDLYSECCSAEPDSKFSTYGERLNMPSGVCSNCLEHCEFYSFEEEECDERSNV